jgi:hypothetical protein
MCRLDAGKVRPKSGKGREKSLSAPFSTRAMGEKHFFLTSTPRWKSFDDAFSAHDLG